MGRSADNNLVVDDERVSRRHAIIHVQGEHEFWLVDLGSINGTYVNDRRVSQPLRLRDGDRIRIGPAQLIFRQATEVQAVSRESATAVEFKSEPCWLLLADIVGSTELARQLNAEQLAMRTGRWLLECKEVIEGHGGIINKYLGDGLLAYWPTTREAATSMASNIQQLRRLQEIGKTPFRFVLHHGPVTMGGVASLGEESLLGPQVNFIFRMEKLAGRLGVRCLLSQSAFTQLGQGLALIEAGTHPLEGFDGEFAFFKFAETATLLDAKTRAT